jgi:heterodisulfide reductase subunit C
VGESQPSDPGGFEKNEEKKCQNVKKEKREEIKKKKNKYQCYICGGKYPFLKRSAYMLRTFINNMNKFLLKLATLRLKSREMLRLNI